MDTSALVAGLRSRRGASHELLRRLNQGEWTLVLSNTLLTEYQEVLHREQTALAHTHAEVERLLDGLCLRAEKRHLRSGGGRCSLIRTMKQSFIWRWRARRSMLLRTTC